MTTRNMMRRTFTSLPQGTRVFLCLALLSQVCGGAEYFHSDNHHQFPAAESPPLMGDFNANSLTGQSIDENGFIFIEDGHFHNKSGRVRFFGLNMTHALFSPKDDAVEMARQLEGLGVNLLRAHYMDFIDIWGSSFRLFGDPTYNYEDFDAEQLDRADFFFSELKRRGIYVYLDFHSGWHYRNTDTYRMKEYTWYRRWIRPYFHRFLRPCYFPSDVLRPLLLKRVESLLPFVRNISLVSFFVYFTLFSLVATAAML